MSTRQARAHFSSRTLALSLAIASSCGLSLCSVTNDASASTLIPTCSFSQLEIAVVSGSGAYAAAGNEGIPFLIVNRSHSACRLVGYPKVRVSPTSYQGSAVKVADGGGMIFVRVKPKRVVIKPGATASFGIDYGDAYNQQDPNAGPCMTQHFYFSLPLRTHPFTQFFDTSVNINFCYAGFHFSVTSIQRGPVPRTG